MKLGVLIKGIGAKDCVGSANSESVVTGLTSDSREVEKGFLFAAMRGSGTTGASSSDGRDFAKDAVSRGAVCILTDKKIDGLESPQVVVENVKKSFAHMAAFFYGEPSDKLSLIGVTGTNGKTTTAYLIESVLKEAGFNVGVMGTVEYRYGGKKIPAPFTTPQAPLLQKVLNDMVGAGITHSVMEISSHGLSEYRVDGCRFEVKVFTNLTQDHLDYHKTMDDYFEAKARLFTDYSLDTGLGHAVINVDDKYGLKIAKEVLKVDGNTLIDYSLTDRSAKVHVRNFDITSSGISANVSTPKGDIKINSPFVGEFNLYNIMAAIGVGCSLDIKADIIEKGINGLKGVRGRLTRVEGSSKNKFSAFVDYAHTPDALERVIKTVSDFTSGRVITVFGCGGDRDSSKRPLMGKAAAELSDVAIVTSDNPRTEDPLSIIKDIEEGMSGLTKFADAGEVTGKGYLVIADRKSAIECAVEMANQGDTILVAGKGHEDYQIIGREKKHFDDAEVLEGALK